MRTCRVQKQGRTLHDAERDGEVLEGGVHGCGSRTTMEDKARRTRGTGRT